MQHKRKIIYLAGFLLFLPVALTTYIHSSFIASFAGEKLVGLIFAISAVISALALLVAQKIFRKIGGSKFLISTIILTISLLFLMINATNIYLAISAFILHLSVNTLIIFALDEILKIASPDLMTGRIRGTYFTAINVASVLALLSMATVFSDLSFRMIYLISLIELGLLLLVSSIWLNDIVDPIYKVEKIWGNIKSFRKNPNLIRAYLMSFLLQFFYSWMVIYTPIYLATRIGFTWGQIGLLFAIMLTPFLFMPFFSGIHSDKFGERKMLMFGFMVAGVSTLYLYIMNTPNLYLWALILFITRVGVSTIESMSDIYFFKHINAENESFVSVYRTTAPTAYLIGPTIATIFLLFIPSFNYIFLVLGAIMLSGVYVASTIDKKDN